MCVLQKGKTLGKKKNDLLCAPSPILQATLKTKVTRDKGDLAEMRHSGSWKKDGGIGPGGLSATPTTSYPEQSGLEGQLASLAA